MLTCRDIIMLVTDYVEGRMGFWDRLRFQLHVGICPSCREFVRQMKLSRDVSKHIPPPALTPEVRDELMARFRDWKTQRPAPYPPQAQPARRSPKN